MSDIPRDPNPNAFPLYSKHASTPGMTLRDYFAGQALTGLLSGRPDVDCSPEDYTYDAYLFADAMLAARKR